MCTRAKVPGLSRTSAFGTSASNGNARVAVFTAGLIRDTLPMNVRSGYASTCELHRLAHADPRRHLLGDFGGDLQRVDADDAHDRRLVLDELAQVDESLLDIAVERRPNQRVAQLPVGELHRRPGRVDAGPKILRVLQRRLIARLLGPQRRVGVVERLPRDELPLVQLVGAVVRLLRLDELGLGFLDIRCLFGRRQVLRIGGAVLRERFRERRLLLLEVVLRLLAIELDQDLSRFHAIPKVREQPADPSFGFGGDRHLVDGGQGADDFDGAVNRLLPDRLHFHGLDLVACVSLGALRLRASGARCADAERQHEGRRAEPHDVSIHIRNLPTGT